MIDWKRVLPLVLVAVIFFALGGIFWPKERSKSEAVPAPTVVGVQGSPTSTSVAAAELVKVTKVVDGDTIVLENGQTVRYTGIDTPETKGDCFATEATDKDKELVLGKLVKLEKDVSETDRYGRLLRYVYVDDVFINDYLVREGYATVSTYPPDVKYQQKFLDSEKFARENNLGLWSKCVSTTPIRSDVVNPIPADNGNGIVKQSNVNCSSNTYNCSHFKTQAEAQNVFDYCMRTVGYDVHKLDRDRDGRVCETLP